MPDFSYRVRLICRETLSSTVSSRIWYRLRTVDIHRCQLKSRLKLLRLHYHTILAKLVYFCYLRCASSSNHVLTLHTKRGCRPS